MGLAAAICDVEGHRIDYVQSRCKVCQMPVDAIERRRIRQEVRAMKADKGRIRDLKGIIGSNC